MGIPLPLPPLSGALERTGDANINHFLETYSYRRAASSVSTSPWNVDQASAARAYASWGEDSVGSI